MSRATDQRSRLNLNIWNILNRTFIDALVVPFSRDSTSACQLQYGNGASLLNLTLQPNAEEGGNVRISVGVVGFVGIVARRFVCVAPNSMRVVGNVSSHHLMPCQRGGHSTQRSQLRR
jgi:hypothetical protein